MIRKLGTCHQRVAFARIAIAILCSVGISFYLGSYLARLTGQHKECEITAHLYNSDMELVDCRIHLKD
jgi:hypothetical protein